MRLGAIILSVCFVLRGLSYQPAYAAESPEKEATSVFFDMCVLTGGHKEEIDKRMEPLFEHNAAKEIPASELKESMGIDANYVWLMRLGKPTQKLMLTSAPNICALHLNSGSTQLVRKEFQEMLAFTAKNVGGKSRIVQEKGLGPEAGYSMYAIEIPNESNELAISLGTTEKPAPKGTKHVMTLSVARKEE